MDYHKKTIKDIDVSGEKILLRCDFNLPMDLENGGISDDERIVASLPTIEYLLDHGAALIVCSHMGRPNGEILPELSLRRAFSRLGKLLNRTIPMAPSAIGPEAKAMAAALQPGEIMGLENLRFYKEEEANDPGFAQELASMADLFVFDAFGACHRAHASTSGVAKYLPAVSGLLVDRELTVMREALLHPKRPFVAVLGGIKISDKIGVISALLEKANTLIIGGGMAYTFYAALGGTVGASPYEHDRLDFVREMMDKARKHGVRLVLPLDNLAAQGYMASARPILVSAGQMPSNLMGMDIGPKSIALFSDLISRAGTIFWNGPMGVFEFPAFSVGTKAIAEAIAYSKAVTIVGGGDSVAAVDQLHLTRRITHISTGGGATLQLIEGAKLPGIACLLDKEPKDRVVYRGRSLLVT